MANVCVCARFGTLAPFRQRSCGYPDRGVAEELVFTNRAERASTSTAYAGDKHSDPALLITHAAGDQNNSRAPEQEGNLLALTRKPLTIVLSLPTIAKYKKRALSTQSL